MTERSARLENLAAMPPKPAPPSVILKDAEPLVCIFRLRHFAINNIEPELLQNRRGVWEEEPLEGEAPELMYLKGQTLEAHKNLHRWCKVIKEELQCDDRANNDNDADRATYITRMLAMAAMTCTKMQTAVPNNAAPYDHN